MKQEWKAGMVNKNLPPEIFLLCLHICQLDGEHSGHLDEKKGTRRKEAGSLSEHK